eukprot:XP_003392040.1 PREDICTED: uncharacterized protein LOC100632855 [Amphimedon queenslandica]
MSGLRYTEDHEWILVEDDGVALTGITHYAQDQLGELVYVGLPSVGTDIDQGEVCAEIESVKAAGELKMPVRGTVLEVNESLVNAPERINSDPTGNGWVVRFRIADSSEVESLMDEEAYNEYTKGLS